ncbi:hypothetical protein VPH35_047615 [Triticum aestivum]
MLLAAATHNTHKPLREEKQRGVAIPQLPPLPRLPACVPASPPDPSHRRPSPSLAALVHLSRPLPVSLQSFDCLSEEQQTNT